jgi:hypothetical protein
MSGDVLLLPLYAFLVWTGTGLPFYVSWKFLNCRTVHKTSDFNVGLPSPSFDAVLASYLVGSLAEVSLHKCKAGPSFK